MATLANLSDLSETLRDARLQATFRSEGQRHLTIHSRGEGSRASRTQEVWAHVKNLGSGAQGFVDLQAKQSAHSRKTPKYRAVKCIRISEAHLASHQDFYRRELEAIVKFSQVGYGDLFVKTYGWYTGESSLFIAMEYCKSGDLDSYLLDSTKCPEGRLPEAEVHDIASQVLEALSTMHEEHFAHRDLKPANILIESHPPKRWMVKLADFGLSRRDQDATGTVVRGTLSFMPPELLGFSQAKGKFRSADLYAVDMYCLGESVFRMLAGKGTFDNHAELSMFCLGHTGFPYETLTDLQVSKQAVDFLSSLIVVDPTERLTAETASTHEWMTMDSPVDEPLPVDLGSDDSYNSASSRASSPQLSPETNVSGSWAQFPDNVKRNSHPMNDDTVASASWSVALFGESGKSHPMNDTVASASWSVALFGEPGKPVEQPPRPSDEAQVSTSHPPAESEKTAEHPSPLPDAAQTPSLESPSESEKKVEQLRRRFDQSKISISQWSTNPQKLAEQPRRPFDQSQVAVSRWSTPPVKQLRRPSPDPQLSTSGTMPMAPSEINQIRPLSANHSFLTPRPWVQPPPSREVDQGNHKYEPEANQPGDLSWFKSSLPVPPTSPSPRSWVRSPGIVSSPREAPRSPDRHWVRGAGADADKNQLEKSSLVVSAGSLDEQYHKQDTPTHQLVHGGHAEDVKLNETPSKTHEDDGNVGHEAYNAKIVFDEVGEIFRDEPDATSRTTHAMRKINRAAEDSQMLLYSFLRLLENEGRFRLNHENDIHAPEKEDQTVNLDEMVLEFVTSMRALADPGTRPDSPPSKQQQTDQAQNQTDSSDSRESLTSIATAAKSAYSNGRLDQAKELYDQAVKVSTELNGKRHVDTMRYMHQRALTLSSLGRYQEAEDEYIVTAMDRMYALGSTHPDTLNTLHYLADAQSQLNKLAKAEINYRAAISGRRKNKDLALVVSLDALINLLTILGRFEEAEPLVAEAAPLKTELFGAEHEEFILEGYLRKFQMGGHGSRDLV